MFAGYVLCGSSLHARYTVVSPRNVQLCALSEMVTCIRDFLARLLPLCTVSAEELGWRSLQNSAVCYIG